MLRLIRQRLVYKLFLSYLFIILIGIIVLAASAEFAIPAAFDHHLSAMMGDQRMGMGMGMSMMDDLYGNYRNAVSEALTRAALAAVFAAVIVSVFVSRKVVAPVKEMMRASQRIAEGKYGERVDVPSSQINGGLDELSQLALAFNRMANVLEQTEQMRIQMIGDVSHELRTPLTTIQGNMEGLMDGVLEADQRTYQVIYQEAGRMKRLVDDLQELSRVEAGAFTLDLNPVSVLDLVDEVKDRLQPQFDEKDIKLFTDVQGDIPLVLADRDRIVQVLLNLVGNALQYTPPGREVTISVHQNGGDVLVEVKDSGIGISPEHISNLFTRFYRVDKSRSRAGGGSGIGLTISKHLIEAHGGRIWAQSHGFGEGSTFTFALPVDRSDHSKS